MRRPISLLRQLDCLFELVESLLAGGGGGGGAGVSSFNSRTGSVTLGSGDVTGALGFTPQTAGDYALTDHNHAGVYSLVGHVHPISEVTGLQAALDDKQAAGSYSLTSHNHDGVYALVGHTHTDATTSVSGFMSGADKTKLNGIATGATANSSDATLLARANHTGTQSLDTTSDSATRLAMTAAERTKLTGIATGATANATDAQLRDRSTHTGTQTASTISDFSEAVDDRVAALITPAGNLQENYDDAGNVLTLTATSGGGADPWTYIRLASDFVTNSATAVDITGMAFTPAASKRYEFEGRLRLRTATATVGARPGLAWPTGFVDGTAEVRGSTSATAEVNAFGNPNASLLVAQTALPNTTQSWPAYVGGEIEMGGSPSGTVKLQLASETGGTNVTCKAGSWLRYREIP